MPIYDYECVACGHRFELRQGFDAPSQQPCPQCDQPARRRIHATAIIFKGSGWYVTDYGRKSPTSVGADEGKPSSDGHSGNGHHHDGHGHHHDAPRAEATSGTAAKEEA